MTLADIKTRLQQLVTEANNQTICPVRVSALGFVVLYHLGVIGGLISHQLTISMDGLGQYMTHMRDFVAAMGLGIGAKSVMKGDAPKEGDEQ